MTINELKRKYPSARFFKMKKMPDSGAVSLESLDDVMELASLFGYMEDVIDSESASELMWESLLRLYTRELSFEERHAFMSYARENITPKLKKICDRDGYTVVTLYGIDCNVMYEEDHDSLEQSVLDEALAELNKLRDRRYRMLEDEQNQRDEAIEQVIDGYCEEYSEAVTKKDKEDVIRKVQLKLKVEFNLDGRSDSRASKIYLKMRYESEETV